MLAISFTFLFFASTIILLFLSLYNLCALFTFSIKNISNFFNNFHSFYDNKMMLIFILLLITKHFCLILIFFLESMDWVGTWGKHMKSVCFKGLKESQKINHFPGTFQIGRKDRLWRNLHKLMIKYGSKEFGLMPKTYVLPHDLKALKYDWDKYAALNDKWIIKPVCYYCYYALHSYYRCAYFMFF